MGSNPTGSKVINGVAEWFKAVDCKSIVYNIVGSNPTAFISYFVKNINIYNLKKKIVFNEYLAN